MQTKKFGNWGESVACDYLAGKKYRILERNFRTKFGEIDIVTTKDDTLVFVEVKTRISGKFGKPEEAVTPYKIAKIARVGEYYRQIHHGLPAKIRIDVIAIEYENDRVFTVKLISAV